MVVERDKTIKKMEDANKKEVAELKVQKKASDDALSNSTEENTRLKDKENTLINIFKCMKPIMDEQLKKSSNVDESGTATQNQSKQQISCDKCVYKADNVNDLSSHKRSVHTIPTNFTCKHCGNNFNTDNELKSHLMTHNNPSNTLYICEDCEFQDLREENVLNHRIAKHSKHSCDRCDYQSNLEMELAKHKLLVHGLKSTLPYQCDDCEFGDDKEENVLNHKIAKHSTKVCDMCDFKSENVAKLEEHARTTHQQTKFSCNICLSSFKTKTMLHDHIKSQHRPDTFPCDYCGYKANSLKNLDDHIEEYHRIKKKSVKSNEATKKTPCDFRSPKHSSSCCDRDQGKAMKIYTPLGRPL
jgi:hypothetical protein